MGCSKPAVEDEWKASAHRIDIPTMRIDGRDAPYAADRRGEPQCSWVTYRQSNLKLMKEAEADKLQVVQPRFKVPFSS